MGVHGWHTLTRQVQRVKNKWKCVLRDGVASIGGRDYLFSKCNGCVAPVPGGD